MARIRTIKPEFWQDELTASWPMASRLAYVALWSEADDEGRLRAHPAYLRGALFPYDEGLDIEAILAPIIEAGRLVRYQVDGQTYGYLPKFHEHQRIDKPSKSKLPAPPTEASRILPESSRALPEASRILPVGTGNREQGTGNREQEKDSPPPPSGEGGAPADAGECESGPPEGEPLTLEPPAPKPTPRRRPPDATALPDLVAAWNERAHPAMPRVREPPKLSGPMRAELRTRTLDGPGGWHELIDRMNRSSWCRGDAPTSTRAMDFSFLLRHPADVANGKYDDRPGRARDSPAPESDFERRMREKYGHLAGGQT